MKRLLALLLAGGVSVIIFGYGLVLSLMLLAAPSLPFVPLLFAALFAFYGASTGVLLIKTWLKPDPQHGDRARSLAAIPVVLWLMMVGAAALNVGFGLPKWSTYIFLTTLVFVLALAAQVGCIRFLSAAQQSVPRDGSRAARENRV